ncbi:MAG: S8 family peptidase [Elusimicrobia bacterium]|nr:S8 family peptidase [Elusimicrobiota bacterium]MDE2426620.1 S8 family peptidase [Elusimicrobiota bacterium]
MDRLAKFVGLLALALSCLCVPSVRASSFKPARRIVVFKASVPAAERVAAVEESGGRVVRRLDFINAVVIETPPSLVSAAQDRLRQDPEVKRIDPDPEVNWLSQAAGMGRFILPDVWSTLPRFVPFRPGPITASAEIPWGIQRVDAPAAWSVTRGAGVKVAVIDTGIDYTHQNLKANIKGGWNAIKNDADFKDDNGHGSHVSGTIAAADGPSGVIGVAPEASLYGVKVLDANGSGTYDDVIAGMQWAVQHKMQVASMSLGADTGNDSLKAAVAAMKKAGVVLVAAAGNSGAAVGYPAAYDGALAIAAMDSSDQVAYFSSRGKQVAFIAPGVDVKSTYMGGGYETLSGTSMATPHVSGLAALAIAAKGLSGYQALRAALTRAATPLPNVPVEQQGAGVIDAAKLVR